MCVAPWATPWSNHWPISAALVMLPSWALGWISLVYSNSMTLPQQVKTIYQLLADDRPSELGLFRAMEGGLKTALADDALGLFSYRSKRPNEMLEQGVIKQLVTAITTSKGYKGINHIGFCYKVDSVDAEVSRVTGLASSKGLSTYQEPSIDDAAWIFVGNISTINNPLLEFLPHQGQTEDQWIDYWLPHIQFDIGTALSPEEISHLVKGIIDRPFTPYSIAIDGVTYIQRVNLGCLEGVNLILDIATNNRDITYRRTWTKLN
jgi:hypothetical protein